MSLLRLNLQAEIAMIEQNIYPILRIVPYFVPYLHTYGTVWQKYTRLDITEKYLDIIFCPKTETNYPPETQEDTYFFGKTL